MFMKQSTLLSALLLLGLSFSLSGCLQDSCDATQTFFSFEPVYRTVEQIREDPTIEGPRSLENPGKIYVYGDYLLVNELYEGIHIINNRDPRNPVNLSFIRIPGNVDMAVRFNMLYADNYIDLLAINIENPEQPALVSRTAEVFPSLGFDQHRGHIVAYNQTEETREVPCDQSNGGWFWRNERVFVAADALSSFAQSNRGGQVSGAAVSGVGGSMARFTMSGHYLYTVDNNNLQVFDLSNLAAPRKSNTVPIGWGIETIFPYKDHLFIGSQTGMFIFDNTNPLEPRLVSTFAHARNCDPVFVEGDLAYVTLRDGNFCQGSDNQMDIVDISNLYNPKLLKTHPMHNPHGLSVVDKIVYLCDGSAGLKVLDATDWRKLETRSHLRHFSTYDVIALPQDNLAIVVGRDGLYQFDITDPAKLRELSRISIARK